MASELLLAKVKVYYRAKTGQIEQLLAMADKNNSFPGKKTIVDAIQKTTDALTAPWLNAFKSEAPFRSGSFVHHIQRKHRTEFVATSGIFRGVTLPGIANNVVEIVLIDFTYSELRKPFRGIRHPKRIRKEAISAFDLVDRWEKPIEGKSNVPPGHSRRRHYYYSYVAGALSIGGFPGARGKIKNWRVRAENKALERIGK